jgi:hypothetical protein
MVVVQADVSFVEYKSALEQSVQRVFQLLCLRVIVPHCAKAVLDVEDNTTLSFTRGALRAMTAN